MSSHSSFHAKFLMGFAALAVLALSSAAEAKVLGVIHAFQGGSDGARPSAPLIEDSAGNFYSTTVIGGTGTACGSTGCGTIFRIAPDGMESVVYSFQGSCDGAYAYAGLLPDGAGNFYGSTGEGGCGGDGNRGTVFKLAADGTESVIYAFKGGKDGAGPVGNLALDHKGNLYGATGGGGKPGYGTVFKIAKDGKEKVLYAFQGGSDGAWPRAGLVRDKQSNLYGTTSNGGGVCNCGTVFKVTSDGTETILHSFQGGSDGGFPYGDLILDKAGNLYGTAEDGGNCCSGTVFKLAPDGTMTILYAFKGNPDGSNPAAGLIMDKQGNLYGTTYFGGGTGCQKRGCGTVFKLTPDGQESVLFSFDNRNGANPLASLFSTKDGALYGTTIHGGKYNDGVVFEVKN